MIACCVIKHHKAGSQAFLFITVNQTFVLRDCFKPLGVFVFGRHQRLWKSFPFVGGTYISLGISQSNLQGAQLVTGRIASDVSDPVFPPVFSYFIGASPFHVLQSHVATALITVPSVLLKREDASQGFPVQ